MEAKYGLLSVALPMSHGEELELPLAIPSEAIGQRRNKEYYIGELGSIVLVEAARPETE